MSEHPGPGPWRGPGAALGRTGGALAAFLLASVPAMAGPLSSAEILRELRSLASTGRVLYVAAHPDDENTRLLAWLALVRGYSVGYLSLTRGDGGQNLVGPELGDSLGVLRSLELLAARRLDGAHQFFTRARDFGFSKRADETLSIWDRREVLRDVVARIRKFRPDVVVSRFPTEASGTHGHHTASAMVAREAFDLAGDGAAFPGAGGAPWKPHRLVWNVFQPRGPASPEASPPPGSFSMEIGAWLPWVGASIGELAARSRSMHKSQGMGSAEVRGPIPERFVVLAGAPAGADLMEGIETGWGRVPGGAGLDAALARVREEFDPEEPSRGLAGLLEVADRVARLPPGMARDEAMARVGRIVGGMLGLHAEALGEVLDVVPGARLPVRLALTVQGPVAIDWLGSEVAGSAAEGGRIPVAPGGSASRSLVVTVPPGAEPAHPHWLRGTGTLGLFEGPGAGDGEADDPPAFPVTHRIEVEGRSFRLDDAVVARTVDPVEGELRDPVRVTAPVRLRFRRDQEVVPPGGRRRVEVEMRAVAGAVSGTLALDPGPGWSASPAALPFSLAEAGAEARLGFELTAPGEPGRTGVGAVATVAGRAWTRDRIELRHRHVATRVLHPEARLTAVALEVKTAAGTVGYLPGAVDGIDSALERLGFPLRRLAVSDLTAEGLAGLASVVVGIRAMNVHEDLAPRLGALEAFAAGGGTVLVQYQNPQGLKVPRLAPYALRVGRDRVTDEGAAVTRLVPDHPALSGPNPIEDGDFAGWVQERGLYFATEWGPEWTPLLSMADPGEGAQRGSLLVARHGKGWWIHTGLSWFRQLPAGVPGAYRLFANLVSLRP